MRTLLIFSLSLLSGLLLAFAWFPHGLLPLLFIAFVPLLIAERMLFNDPKGNRPLTLFASSYLCFVTWNFIVTWWVKNASIGGAVMAILANALLMAFVFMLFHRVKRRIGETWGAVVFICFWLGFEFLHLDWDLTWPWLTLGNAFADQPEWIQWYEYTGIFGGSLWVLVTNVMACELVLNWKKQEKRLRIRNASLITGIVLLPIILSYSVFQYKEDPAREKINVLVIQPNIDPYNEKFYFDHQTQLIKMLTLAKDRTDSTTDYLLLPETALTEDMWEGQLERTESVMMLRSYLKNFPKLKIIIGASTVKAYGAGEERSSTARKFTNDDAYYDSYNTALQIDNSNNIQVYHKSKLVPGVEKMPFPVIFNYFERYAIEMGGTSGSLGMQEERTVFTSGTKAAAAPVICYESIYGEYVGQYLRNGANFIAIITNDGWWGDTPGYKQHLKYGALRAIESRTWIARSANTGISCFIDPCGHILQPTSWWQPAVISQQISLSASPTFYTNYGDYIARAALCIALAMLIYSLLIRFRIAKKW